MAISVSFYAHPFRESFTCPIDFSVEEYAKFKKLCVAYAKEERVTLSDLGGLAEWCSEKMDDSWISSIYSEITSNIYQFLVEYTINGGFGKPDAVISSIYDEFCEEFPDFYDEFGSLEYPEAAIEEFFAQLECDYEPMYELEIKSL